MTSPIKLNVVYSITPFGSESKPEERGTSDEGASDEVRADLLDTRTVQVAKIRINVIFIEILSVLAIYYLDLSFSRKDPTRRVALRRKRLGFRLRGRFGFYP